jgi:hypothetical protein
MDGLTLFGLFAVTAMLVCYALEDRSHWFILAFAAACALGSVYGFLQGAWPFGLVEAVWAGSRCGAGLPGGPPTLKPSFEIGVRRRPPVRSSSGRRQNLAARCTDAQHGAG